MKEDLKLFLQKNKRTQAVNLETNKPRNVMQSAILNTSTTHF